MESNFNELLEVDLANGLASLGIVASYIFISSFITGVKKHYKLCKVESHTNIAIDALPECITKNKNRPEKLDIAGIKEEVTSYILKFVETLSDEKHIDLDNFYKNLKSCSIEIVDEIYSASVYYKELGGFDTENNKITLLRGHESKSIFSTLLCLASHREVDDMDIDGFHRIKYSNGFRKKTLYGLGSGLNTGYTQLLTERFFGDEDILEGVYELLFNLAYLIEDILGFEDMEAAYFKGDLSYVIDGLAQYCKEEEAIKIIRQIDHIKSAIEDGIVPAFLVRKTYNDVFVKLSRMFIEKYKRETDPLKARSFILYMTSFNMINEMMNERHNIFFRIPREDKKAYITEVTEALKQKGLYLVRQGDRILVTKKKK